MAKKGVGRFLGAGQFIRQQAAQAKQPRLDFKGGPTAAQPARFGLRQVLHGPDVVFVRCFDMTNRIDKKTSSSLNENMDTSLLKNDSAVLISEPPATLRRKAVSYIRYSSLAQGKEGRNSTQRQSNALQAALAQWNLELDQEFIDKGKSGYHQQHLSKGSASILKDHNT